MADAHNLDCESEAIDCRFGVQSEYEREATELAKNHVQEDHDHGYSDDELREEHLQVVYSVAADHHDGSGRASSRGANDDSIPRETVSGRDVPPLSPRCRSTASVRDRRAPGGEHPRQPSSSTASRLSRCGTRGKLP